MSRRQELEAKCQRSNLSVYHYLSTFVPAAKTPRRNLKGREEKKNANKWKAL